MWSFGVLLFWGCCVMCSWEKTMLEPKTGVVNKCADTTVCPAYATCTNTMGSYYCTCKRGFLSSKRQSQFSGPGVKCEDVNECADTTVCPTFATCTNTMGSYYCTCKRGFLSSNGQSQFRGPGVRCKDVDECTERPPRCGPNSVCKNLEGMYKCSCLPGFSSPTGDWAPGQPGTFSCTDIDECLRGGVCPEHSNCANSAGSYSCTCQAGFVSNDSTCEDVNECGDTTVCPAYGTCTNTMGSYYCSCKQGFLSSNGQSQFRGPGVTCEDVDECTERPPRCGPNSVCKNLEGRYKCSCLPGFSSPTGDWAPGQPGNLTCTDIDECLRDGVCPEHSNCANAVGSYSCRCKAGFISNGSTCEGIPFKCKEDMIAQNEQVQQCHTGAAVKLEYVPFCTLMNATFQVLDKTCENKTMAVPLQETAEGFTFVLQQKLTWTKFSREEMSALGTVLLESVESTTLTTLLKPSENASQTVQTEHLDIESKVITQECLEENVSFAMKAKADELKIGCSVIKESESTGSAGVAFVSFTNMESLSDERFFLDPQRPWTNSKQRLRDEFLHHCGHHDRGEEGQPLRSSYLHPGESSGGEEVLS